MTENVRDAPSRPFDEIHPAQVAFELFELESAQIGSGRRAAQEVIFGDRLSFSPVHPSKTLCGGCTGNCAAFQNAVTPDLNSIRRSSWGS